MLRCQAVGRAVGEDRMVLIKQQTANKILFRPGRVGSEYQHTRFKPTKNLYLALASLSLSKPNAGDPQTLAVRPRSDVAASDWPPLMCFYQRLRNSWIGFRDGYFSMSNRILRPQRMIVSHFCMNCPNWRGDKAIPFHRSVMQEVFSLQRWHSVRFSSNGLVTLNTDNNVARFSLVKPITEPGIQKPKRPKMSRKAKLNQLKWYRLKAKKKMKSPNPEVRIRYKLEKAKRKEEWLIEKLRKFNIPKGTKPVHDPEILTIEERFYLKRTGEKKKNYVPVGRRGVFGGVVLNMHLHWKNHETVKVVCKPCKPGQVHEYAEEIARLSKGTVIDIKHNTIIFYRGKNYVQPEVMSPPNTLSKQKALEKYKFEQSLEHTSQFIEKLEKELEEYHNHIAMYRKSSEEVASNKFPSAYLITFEEERGCHR